MRSSIRVAFTRFLVDLPEGTQNSPTSRVRRIEDLSYRTGGRREDLVPQRPGTWARSQGEEPYTYAEFTIATTKTSVPFSMGMWTVDYGNATETIEV